jgi:hypothetical protein
MWEATSGRRSKTEKIYHEEHEGHEAGGESFSGSETLRPLRLCEKNLLLPSVFICVICGRFCFFPA